MKDSYGKGRPYKNTYDKGHAIRNTYTKSIAGQKDKKTGSSALSNSDNHSQRHEGQTQGHGMGSKPAHSSGYQRTAHHGELLKNHRSK